MRPVDLAFQMVELLSLHQPVGLTDLSRLASLPKSTAKRTLAALQEAGWAEPQSGDRPLWSLTMRALVASGRAGRRVSGLRNVALPVMEQLRRTTEETIHLTYRFERSLVLIERLDGIKPVAYFLAYGTVYDLHATSAGKSILSRLSSEELDEYLALPLRASTAHTITDADRLRDDLKGVRDRGYAVTLGGNVADVHAVGAPICDRTGRPVAAVSISAPAERLNETLIAQYGPAAADAARRISMGFAGFD